MTDAMLSFLKKGHRENKFWFCRAYDMRIMVLATKHEILGSLMDRDEPNVVVTHSRSVNLVCPANGGFG